MEYICVCGKKFDNSQAFNGHKSHCKAHIIHKYGNLSTLETNEENRLNKLRETCKNKHELFVEESSAKWIAEKHVCETCGVVMKSKFGSGRFCSRSCANSRGIRSDDTKLKISKGVSNAVDSHKKKHMKHLLEYDKNPKMCKVCGAKLDYKNRRRSTCSDECLRTVHTETGLISSSKVNKRSRNEIHFCNLCEDYFGSSEVLHNEPMFNGWDADIILPDKKIAVLWNGPWHYQKITNKHSVKQVQARDAIKIKEIENFGYIAYIIKDMGSEDITKVHIEFENFLNNFNLHK